jgi:hypothetical protein
MKRARVYLLAAIILAAICVVPTEAAWLYPGYGYNYGYSYNPYGLGFYGFIPYGFNPHSFYFYGFNPYVLRPYHYWNYGYNYNPRGYRFHDYGYGYDPYGYGPYSYYHYGYRYNPRRYGPRGNEPDSFYTEDWHETDDAFTEWYDAY